MKSIFLFFFAFLFCLCLLAQVPQAFNYQGVARDLDGSALPEQQIGLRITILGGPLGDAIAYRETHQIVTNKLGLFTIQIGTGTNVNSIFEEINWGDGPHFLQIEMDENGGNNYQLIGTTQLLSVPYALYAGNTNSPWSRNEDTIYYEQGYVGIGLSSPRRGLHLRGDNGVIQVDRNRPSPAIQFGRYQDFSPFTFENYELGFGMGVDSRENDAGGFLYIAEDVNKDFAAGLGDGGIHLVIQKGGNMGLGTLNPKSKLQITDGDVYIENVNRGVIMKSPNGQCWRYTPNNNGQLVGTLVSCPN